MFLRRYHRGVVYYCFLGSARGQCPADYCAWNPVWSGIICRMVEVVEWMRYRPPIYEVLRTSYIDSDTEGSYRPDSVRCEESFVQHSPWLKHRKITKFQGSGSI